MRYKGLFTVPPGSSLYGFTADKGFVAYEFVPTKKPLQKESGADCTVQFIILFLRALFLIK